MNILFCTNQISERGTETAIYDYAEGNESVLAGKSYIAYPRGRVLNQSALTRFTARFETLPYESRADLDDFISRKSIDLVYQIESGEGGGPLTTAAPTFIHCVFSTRKPAGTYYVTISSFLNRYYRTRFPVLHHIVKRLPPTSRNLREELGIPAEATVFGGYGGASQFDIPFAQRAVRDTAALRPDVFFVFMNFSPFPVRSDNVLFLPGSVDLDQKSALVSACDAMLHARSDGETFGLSVAEFSACGKPIITWRPSFLRTPIYSLRTALYRIAGRRHRYATAHIDFLGRFGMYYANYASLMRILRRFKKSALKGDRLDRYSIPFSSETVMRKFREIVAERKTT